MTSKEALSNLRWNTSMSQDCNYKENNELCDIIEKDLEILEILKNNFAYSTQLSSEKGIERTIFSFDIPTSELQKIKEWLDEK